MSNYSLKYTIPWIVRLYPIWKPIYEKDNNEYILKYIEIMVFIHSILDSDGKEVDLKNIDYLTLVKKSDNEWSVKIPEVILSDSSSKGDNIKNFKMNDVLSDSYDAGASQLNSYISNKKSCDKKNYFVYGNFIDKIYGTNSEITFEEYEKNTTNENYDGYENGLLFEIHLKGYTGSVCSYSFDKNKTKKYIKDFTNKGSYLLDSKVVYGMASNPFFLPSAIFDDRSNDLDIYSFFNEDKHNLTQCFVCSRDVNKHIDDKNIMKKIDGFKKFYTNSDYDKNRNCVWAVKNLYCRGNIKLSLCSPYNWEESENKCNIYQRYNGGKTLVEYKNSGMNFSDIAYVGTYWDETFGVMDSNTKQLVCYHNYVEDNNGTNNNMLSDSCDYDVSYNIKNNFGTLVKKPSFKKKFCIDEDEYNPTKYLDCSVRKSELNFGTITWKNNKYNSLCEIWYSGGYGGWDYSDPKSIGNVYDNKWFFGDISNLEKPCLLFYGMYKVDTIL